MVIVDSLVDVTEVVFMEWLPILGSGFANSFDAIALKDNATANNIVLVIFMFFLILIATGAVGKAFMVLKGR